MASDRRLVPGAGGASPSALVARRLALAALVQAHAALFVPHARERYDPNNPEFKDAVDQLLKVAAAAGFKQRRPALRETLMRLVKRHILFPDPLGPEDIGILLELFKRLGGGDCRKVMRELAAATGRWVYYRTLHWKYTTLVKKGCLPARGSVRPPTPPSSPSPSPSPSPSGSSDRSGATSADTTYGGHDIASAELPGGGLDCLFTPCRCCDYCPVDSSLSAAKTPLQLDGGEWIEEFYPRTPLDG